MTNLIINKLPREFYDPTHPKRWQDDFTDLYNKDSVIITPRHTQVLQRNQVYANWLAHFKHTASKRPILRWQTIRVLTAKHSESDSARNWWFEKFQESVFRVFGTPHTVYDGKHYKQWYILHPADSGMVKRYQLEQKGIWLKPFDYRASPWLPPDKELRRMLMVPVECCKQYRHETTAGQLPEGL